MARRRCIVTHDFQHTGIFLSADLPGHLIGTPLDQEALDCGICLCFSAKAGTKVDA